jgi:(E)-4-hydroxy-3-methylbut-2-enyl-diphosphate synthase
MRLADAGCEIARITVQGMKEADACEKIKGELLRQGYTIPLVADIHFFPPAALRAADFVDKVRINPGNYADQRASFKTVEYDDASYARGLEKIEEKFTPLVEKCKRLGRAMRIGTNHGSLSDRIMNRYGDTPRGMVESALEFARICRSHDYHDLIFSMKSSNPKIMVQAYRLLVSEMISLGWNYPLHLGVTEAGEGEDGRIKSAMGIGSLLLEGLGDTIRVSLTEDPWNEIGPCKQLIALAVEAEAMPLEERHRRVEPGPRRPVVLPKGLNLHRDGTVIVALQQELSSVGCEVVSLPQIRAARMAKIAAIVRDESPSYWSLLKEMPPSLILLSPSQHRLSTCRRFFDWLKEQELPIPVILGFQMQGTPEDLIVRAAAEYGSLLCDGLGEGLWIDAPCDPEFLHTLSLNILQAARLRMSKTDFISCPSCGRTLFDLQDVSKRIRARTSHLPGVKIAIMGCIVNGPGEMADADFGYVGSKPGKVDLYVGKTCVERDIDFIEADDRLVALIRHHGRWVNPVSVS